MEDNKSKNPGKGKTLKIGRSHGGGYVPGSDVIGEFRTLGETKGLFGSTDYDEGLVHGLNQDDYAARQQSNWKAIGNSFVQLVTGTVGDIIATPGYVFEGVGAVAPIFGSSEEMDNIFIDAGNWLKGVGEEAAPIYMDQASKETLFNPFDGEWTANTIAQFGPTVAMLAATFLTEGLAYPALANRLGKLGQVGKHIANAEQWIQSGSEAAQLTKSARMAVTSRMIEGGMEAYETFNSTYADLIRKGHSEEKAKKLAGDASAKVYTNNFMLAAVDMLQFNGILDALGTAGKFSKLKGAANLGGQMGSEAFEEGYQYAVAQEAKNEIAYRLGEKKQDSTIFDEFLDGLSNTEMQQAMVQGALGGAVFTAVGKAATRIADNYKSKVTKAQKFQNDNNQYKLAEVNNQHVYDVINQHAQEGKLDVLKKSFQNAINTKGVTPEQAENSQKAISYIDYYDQIANSINEADPDVKEKKIKNLFAQRFNEEYISDVSSQLSQYETDINAQKKSAAEKLKAAKKAKNESLIKKYEEEVRQLKETEKGSPTPTSNDTIIERLANLVVTAENNLDTARKEFKEFNSKEKREEVKKEKAEQIRQERLSEVQTEATKAQTPSQLEVQKDAYKNDTEALDILKAVENNKAKAEVGNTKEPITTDVDTILDYYKDKPFARKRKFNVNTQDELISKLGPASTTETTNEDKGKKFLEGAAKAQKEAKEESKKETAETTEPASKELPPAVESTSTLPKKEKPIKQILNESVENESRKEAKPSEIDQVPQEEETNNSESEELEQAFENEDGKDQSYAQVYDTGLFKFQKFKGQWGIYLNHIQGGFIPVDSVEEVRDGNGDYLYHKVDSSSITQYHIPKKLRINEYYPLKDSKGYPIKSTFGNVIRDYNIDAVKELYKYKDEEVFIEIDTQDNFNATQQSGRIRIDYVIYPNGVRTVIGVMPAVKEYSKDSYKEIRQQIFNELIANNRTPNTESKTFRYSKSTKIGKILGGRFNTFYDKSQRNNPKSVINDNNPLILGVGYNIPGNFDSYDIHLNLNVEDNRENNLQPPNSKLAEFAKDKPIKKGRLTTGQPYVLVRNANNDLIPIRVFSKPVKSVPRLRDKLLNLIREFKKDAAAEIIKFNVVNKKGVKKLIPDFDNNLSDIYSGVKVVLSDGKIQFKSQLGGANFSIQKNSEGVEYSKKGLTEGMILVDTTSNTNYQLTEKVNGKWQVQKLDSKFNKVGESTSAEFLNEAMAQGNIELHYAYNYYMFYDMDNRPLQIDHKKVNIGNYNETVANERLESDLVPKNNFASPKFQVDLNTLRKKEQPKKKEAAKKEVPKNIEQRKKDIEKRRKEELSKANKQYKGDELVELELTPEGELGFRVQGWIEIRNDLVKKLDRKDSKKAQSYVKALMKVGKTFEEISKLVKEKFGISVSAGKYILQETTYNKINAKYDAELAALEQSIQVKEGIPELFESNPELADAVYEALGFEQESNLKLVSKEIPFNYGNNKELVLSGDKTITSRNFKFIPNLQQGESGLQVIDGVPFKITYHGELKHSEVKSKVGIEYSEGEAFTKTTKGKPTEKATEDFIKGIGTKHIYQLQRVSSQITPQQKQEAQRLYSQYLDTIFPDSKVKDIVYHGTKSKKFEKFELQSKGANTNAKAFFFAKDKYYARSYSNKPEVISALINVLNYQEFTTTHQDTTQLIEQNKIDKDIYDTVITNDPNPKNKETFNPNYDSFFDTTEYAVFKPEQIHILGSKQDIKGFKEFVSKQTSPTSKTVSKGIKVEQYTITEKGGKYFYENGNEVTDEVTINKYLVKRDYDPNRKVSHANTEYYVLPDNRIISLGKTTKGKERFKSGKTREKILSKVTPSVSTTKIEDVQQPAQSTQEQIIEVNKGLDVSKVVDNKKKVNTPETTIESKPTETGESPVEGKVLSPLEMMRRKRATKKDTPQEPKVPALKEIREQVENLLTKEKIALEEAYEEAKQDVSNSQDNSTLEKFVSNQVVNYNTGKRVMSKIKDIIKKISKAILSVAVISSLYFTNTAFISPDTKIEKSEFFTRAANGVVNYQDSINVGDITLTGNAAKVYALQQNNFNKGELKSGYVIADKPNARVLIFDSSNNLVKEFPSIFGANYGDQQFKVSIAWENLTPEGKAKFKNPYNYYNQLGIPKITPAGTFKLSKLDNTDYGSEYIYALEGTNSGGLINAFHPNIKSTTKNLKSSNIEDNKASFGCVSVSIENWKSFVEPNLNSDSVIFVLPDSESTEFNPESIGTSVDPYVWDVSNKLEKLGVEIPKFKTVDSNKPREVWNKEEELAWLKENLPNVSNKVYDSLTFLKQFGINGYGAFYNGAIHLLESAQAGTTYHEAFHAVFNMYLSEKEASRILRAADKRYNVSPKEVSDMIDQVRESGIDISETEARELVLEEKLADDFMEYVKAKNVEKNTSITGRIKRFFEGLYNFITSLVNNKPTIDQLFWRINEGQFANKEFKRDVSSILPKFKKHPLYPNPAEYQRVIDTMTSVLDDVLSTFREQNPDTPIKDIVKNNLLFPSKAEVTAEDLADNLILSLDNENSVYNKVLDRMAELDSQGILDEETAQQFNDFLNALAIPVEKEDGTISLRPKLLAFDILKNLSSRGIIINLDTRKLEEDEFGRAEIEPDNTDFVEENDMREAWQILSFTIPQLDKLGEKLKFEFNKIPVVKWTDSSKTEVTPVEGFLSFNRHYNLGHVYRQVQQVAGNSFSRLNMENKLRTAALSKPMFKYIMDTYGSDNDFLGLLWIHIGQKQHPKFVSAIQDKDRGKVRSKVIPTNAVSKVNKITENLVGSLFTNSSLFTSTGKPNVEKAKEVNSKFNKIKEVIKNHYSSNAGKKLPDNILESFYEALQSINLSIPIEALEYANDRNNKDFRKVMTNKTNSIYSFIENIANGKDPIEEGNDGIKNFVKQISSGYDYDVQDAHKNSTGGQVYEWLDSNFLGRTILELKDKVAGIKKIQSLQQDMYYQFSPLLNLIKNGHSETPNNIDYYLNPNEINFAIPSEIKMVGESLPTEYSNMSERQLYINLLMLYYNSNHVGNKAYLPLPVHADSPTMTAIEIPVIKNLNTKETGQKGILDYLNDAAYQELVRVKLDRTTTKNQKSKNRDSNGNSKFLFFDVLESNTPTFKGLNKKKELLSLDLEQDQDRIREILAEVVEEQYNNTLMAERTKMEELNIISYNSEKDKYEWKDELLNNTPVEVFAEHFVANFMLFQNQFTGLFNGDLSYYKNVGDYYKRAKQIWSPGTYLDTTQTRVNFNAKILKTNAIDKNMKESSYDAIYAAALALYGDEAVAKKVAAPYEKGVDETDAQSYIDLFRYKEQQEGLHRWNNTKEQSYRRLLKGEFNIQDMENLELFNVNKPFYFGFHYNDATKEVYPVQNKNSEAIIIPAFANPNNTFYNPKFKEMLLDMGYNENGTIDNIEEFEAKRRAPNNNLTDQFVFDSAIKLGLFGESDNIKEAKTHKFNNSDWRLQMETPIHHVNDKVVFATQVRKHMLNDLEMDSKIYRDPDNPSNMITGAEWLEKYNEVIIKDIQESYSKVSKKFDNFDSLINTLREEVIKRDLGDQYLQALDYWKEQVTDLDGNVTEVINTKLPLWHPLHLYRIESMLNSLFTKGVTRQELTNGVTLANMSSYGFRDKPKLVFNKDGSLNYMEAYAPVYDKKLYPYIDENGKFNEKQFDKDYGKGASEKALRGIVWRIPNEDKYSTFSIRIKGFLPQETGGTIVLPPEVTTIAGLD